jgi:hypothetical protein
MGFLTPNRPRDGPSRQELEEAFSGFLADHHFAQKLAALERQLTDYRGNTDAVALLSRQLARLQKESDLHQLAFQMGHLEEFVKR